MKKMKKHSSSLKKFPSFEERKEAIRIARAFRTSYRHIPEWASVIKEIDKVL